MSTVASENSPTAISIFPLWVESELVLLSLGFDTGVPAAAADGGSGDGDTAVVTGVAATCYAVLALLYQPL